MASISTYALGLFEIVENILSLVDSPKTLYACARVNKMWSDDSLKRMWKGSVRDEKWRTPSMAVLRRMASVSLERLRWYLNAVRHLAIKNDDSVYIASSISNHLFYDTIFKSATPFSVAVDIGLPLMTEAFMTQLLQPKLRRLELCRGHFSDRFFDPIRLHSPQLESLVLHNKSDLMTSQGFLQFLHAMPYIRQLELIQGFNRIITEPVLLHLLRRPNLERLALHPGPCFDDLLLQRAEAMGIDRCFPALRSFELTEKYPIAVSKILPTMRHLQEIKLNLCEEDEDEFAEDILAPLGHCKSLQEIDFAIALGSSLRLPLQAFLDSIESWKFLRRLTLEASIVDYSSEDGTALNPGGLIALAKGLPHIETLSVNFKMNYGPDVIQELAAFALHCPQLRELDFAVVIDILKLPHVPDCAVFNSMKKLRLRSAFACDAFTPATVWIALADKIDLVLQRYMPLLETFTLSQYAVNDLGNGSGLVCKEVNKRLKLRAGGLRKFRPSENVKEQLNREMFARARQA